MRKTTLLRGSLSKQPDSDPAILADEAGAETAGGSASQRHTVELTVPPNRASGGLFKARGEGGRRGFKCNRSAAIPSAFRGT